MSSEKLTFDNYWRALPVEARRHAAYAAGTSDEYIKKYLLTHKRTPSAALVTRLYNALPAEKGGFTHDDLVLYFFKRGV